MLIALLSLCCQSAPDRDAPAKIEELTQKMLRLAERLEKTEPDQAARLRRGVKLLQERGASDRAQRAVDEWTKGNPENATRHRESVVDSLQRLLNLLEGKEQRKPDIHTTIEELLVALEAELLRLITAQSELNAEIRREEGKAMSRSQQMAFRAFAERQRALRATVDELQRILAEKQCEVFAFALGRVADDMGDLADRTSDGKIDRPLQDAVIRRLKELLEALREKQKELKDNPPGGGDDGDDGAKTDPHKVPTAAELELVRKMQLDLYERTKAAGAGMKDLTETETVLLRRLSDEQGRLAELMKGLIDRMKKE